MSLNNDTAKKFFAALYENQPVGLTGNFDSAVTALVAKQGDAAVTGDHALQSLMLNYVLSNPQNAEKAKGITAALAGIKQLAVAAFTKTYPGISLNDLITKAKASGHDVQVLGRV